MICRICSGNSVEIIYTGKMRDGKPGQYTKKAMAVYQCGECSVIWHNGADYSIYESNNYRENLGEKITLTSFYENHDFDVISKLNYTGTTIFRNKLFMDIGCAGGSFADFIRGVASSVVLIEPNYSFASQLRDKGYEVFTYAENALGIYENRVELVTSFDVIEHVYDPFAFVQTIYKLLAPNGKAIIGAPTDYPVLRKLLGDIYNSFVFSVQHPWVFSRRSLEVIAERCGFSDFTIKFYQLYGLGNMIAWLQTHKPQGDMQYDFISPELNSHYKSEMSKEETAEYIILELSK